MDTILAVLNYTALAAAGLAFAGNLKETKEMR